MLDKKGTIISKPDSRKINTCDIYIPLKGENFDGHDFIESAVQQGARGYFTSDKDKIIPGAKFILYIEDTLIAYMQIALMYKKKINPITVAITGSSGKTTTKEEIKFVLSRFTDVYATEGNHNNFIGVPESLCNMSYHASNNWSFLKLFSYSIFIF